MFWEDLEWNISTSKIGKFFGLKLLCQFVKKLKQKQVRSIKIIAIVFMFKIMINYF
jgi:hypothetical protein